MRRYDQSFVFGLDFFYNINIGELRKSQLGNNKRKQEQFFHFSKIFTKNKKIPIKYDYFKINPALRPDLNGALFSCGVDLSLGKRKKAGVEGG